MAAERDWYLTADGKAESVSVGDPYVSAGAVFVGTSVDPPEALQRDWYVVDGKVVTTPRGGTRPVGATLVRTSVYAPPAREVAWAMEHGDKPIYDVYGVDVNLFGTNEEAVLAVQEALLGRGKGLSAYMVGQIASARAGEGYGKTNINLLPVRTALSSPEVSAMILERGYEPKVYVDPTRSKVMDQASKDAFHRVRSELTKVQLGELEESEFDPYGIIAGVFSEYVDKGTNIAEYDQPLVSLQNLVAQTLKDHSVVAPSPPLRVIVHAQVNKGNLDLQDIYEKISQSGPTMATLEDIRDIYLKDFVYPRAIKTATGDVVLHPPQSIISGTPEYREALATLEERRLQQSALEESTRAGLTTVLSVPLEGVVVEPTVELTAKPTPEGKIDDKVELPTEPVTPEIGEPVAPEIGKKGITLDVGELDVGTEGVSVMGAPSVKSAELFLPLAPKTGEIVVPEIVVPEIGEIVTPEIGEGPITEVVVGPLSGPGGPIIEVDVGELDVGAPTEEFAKKFPEQVTEAEVAEVERTEEVEVSEVLSKAPPSTKSERLHAGAPRRPPTRRESRLGVSTMARRPTTASTMFRR